MKKAIVLIICIGCIASLLSCGNTAQVSKTTNTVTASASPTASITPSVNPSTDASPSITPTPSASPSDGAISVSEGLLDVKITIPASIISLSSGKSSADIIAAAKAQGINDVVANADGSYTYTMTKAKHEELIKSANDSLVSSINSIKTKESFNFINDITYDKGFDNFTVAVDGSTYKELYCNIAVMGIALSDMLCKVYAGVKTEDMHIVFTIQDAATKSVLNTVEYPKALNKT